MSKTTIRPLGHRVLILPDQAEDKTQAGIILLEAAKEKPSRGVVVAVGDGKPNDPVTVQIGDHVLYKKGSGMEVKEGKEMYLIMLESDIFSII